MNKPRQSCLSGSARKLLLCCFLILSGFSSFASHFMYGSISWDGQGATSRTVNFTVLMGFRLSEYPGFNAADPNTYPTATPGIRNMYTTDNNLQTGQGAVPIVITIDQINLQDSFYYGHFYYSKDYTGNQNSFTAYVSDASRFYKEVNNHDIPYYFSSQVVLGSDNDAPNTNLPVVITMPAGANATFNLADYVGDDNGDNNLSYFLTPNGQFGAGTVQPAGLSVSSNGVLTFNTVGKVPGQYWNTSVIVVDQQGASTQLDFLIRITPAQARTATPMFVAPTPLPSGTTVTGTVGTTLTFPVVATDADGAADVVTLTAISGMPAGSTFTATPGNPANGTFTWNAPAAGDYTVTFQAADLDAAQPGHTVTTVVKIHINPLTTGCDPNFKITGITSGNTGCAANVVYKGYGNGSITLTVNHTTTTGCTTYTYKWYANNVLVPALTTKTITVSPTANTSYKVEVICGNCSAGSANASNIFMVKYIDARCGNKMDKVYVCHNTGSSSNPHVQICVSPNAVPAHVSNHGDCVGLCSVLFGSARMAEGNSSIPTFGEDQALQVYPNPARGQVNLVYRDMGSDYRSFTITDINGRLVGRQDLTEKRDGKVSIDISNYAPGIYMLRVVNGTGTYVTKFVVE